MRRFASQIPLPTIPLKSCTVQPLRTAATSYAQTLTGPVFDLESDAKVKTPTAPSRYISKDGEINLFQLPVSIQAGRSLLPLTSRREQEVTLNAVYLVSK